MRLSLLYLSCYLSSAGYSFIYMLSLYVTSIGGSPVDVGMVLFVAGIVTILLVGFSGRIANIIGPSSLCAIGTLCCALGFQVIRCFNSISPMFYLCGLMIGAGWSLYYAASPMILNQIVVDKERGKHISRMAAFIVLGGSSGPLISDWCLHHNISIHQVYIFPVVICFISACLFFIQAIFCEKNLCFRPSKATNSRQSQLKTILASEAWYPMERVFLGACVLSSMMNFQVLYSQSKGLDYATFYIFYTLSVVAARFLFGGLLSKKDPRIATPYLLALMVFGLIVMIFNRGNVLLYILSAISLGISYGLTYTLNKTYAINITVPALRNEMLAYFTLCYFLGIYGFPLLGSYLIKHYGYTVLLSLLVALALLDWVIGSSRSKKNAHRYQSQQ